MEEGIEEEVTAELQECSGRNGRESGTVVWSSGDWAVLGLWVLAQRGLLDQGSILQRMSAAYVEKTTAVSDIGKKDTTGGEKEDLQQFSNQQAFVHQCTNLVVNMLRTRCGWWP
eukprot:3149318-Amphidinium_carterae.1